MIKQKSRQTAKNPLGKWSPQDFIQTCWQKEALLIPAAIPEVQGTVHRKDLIAIACNAEAEARLIISDAKQKDWQCEQGPFKLKQFKSLPTSHWTLLVQAVDQWMPEMAALLKRFDFLPRWRLDDIMISYASDGGGVGPHFDYYDVFLLQASGARRWQIGQRCDEHTPLRDHPDMKLLKHFKQGADYTLQTGDMLYIPAGVAHWGTAIGDDCITISIGFRAAAQRELIQMALHKIACDLPDSLRYRDSINSIDADPFCINDHAIKNVKTLWAALDSEQITHMLAQALGEYATEPHSLHKIDADNIESDTSFNLLKLNSLLKNDKPFALQHNSASRFAYRTLTTTTAELYVDGETHLTSLKLAKAICHEKFDKKLIRKESDKNLLLSLINQGSLLLQTINKSTFS